LRDTAGKTEERRRKAEQREREREGERERETYKVVMFDCALDIAFL
jgi:hypothetical protein